MKHPRRSHPMPERSLPDPQPGLRHTQAKSEEDFDFDLEGDVEAPAEMQNEAVLSGVDPAAPEPEDAQPPVRSPVAHGAVEVTDPAPMTDYKARTQKRIADALAQKACTQKAREAATPTGGQRILLDDAGKAVPVTPAKPSFGSLSGCPARFPTGDGIDAGEPLLVAEGSETALTLRLATGYETWAVFGVSNWQSAPLPLDRDIILAPDRDAALSPAGKTFRKAVAHHLQRGCRLRIAPAPEPEGSKKDLNDKLMDQGIAAVRAALEAAYAPKPEYLPDETADKSHESESHGETAGASGTYKNGKDMEKDTEKDDEQPKGQSGPGGSEWAANASKSCAGSGPGKTGCGKWKASICASPAAGCAVAGPAQNRRYHDDCTDPASDPRAFWASVAGVAPDQLVFPRAPSRLLRRWTRWLDTHPRIDAYLARARRPWRILWFGPHHPDPAPLPPTPVNLAPWTNHLLPHSDETPDKSGLARLRDRLLWHLSHPATRFETHAWRCRSRADMQPAWRLRTLRNTLAGQPTGPAPWIDAPPSAPSSSPQQSGEDRKGYAS